MLRFISCGALVDQLARWPFQAGKTGPTPVLKHDGSKERSFWNLRLFVNREVGADW